MNRLKHVGIAGITVPGALLCIDAIVEESYKHFGRESMIHPQITFTILPLNETEPPFIAKDWNQVAKDILCCVDVLYKAGVDFIVMPSNSPHYAIKQVQEKSPVPFLSIVDLTVDECKKRGFKKVGILGVGVTMSDGLYAEPLKKIGLEPINLSPERQKQVNDLIYNEIIIGKPTPQTADKMRTFIQELKDMGADSFISGCTEIPVVITSEDGSPLPFVDTTRLLAKKAFEHAAGIS